jgi:hypothetical protein
VCLPCCQNSVRFPLPEMLSASAVSGVVIEVVKFAYQASRIGEWLVPTKENAAQPLFLVCSVDRKAGDEHGWDPIR